MFTLSQVTLTPGRRDGEYNARFIASKEDMTKFAPTVYAQMFQGNGTPYPVIGTLRLKGDVPNAQLKSFQNGEKITTKCDLEEIELEPRADGKIAGTALIDNPRLAGLLAVGLPYEIEGDSPWVKVAGNGRANTSGMQMRKKGGRPPGSKTKPKADAPQPTAN